MNMRSPILILISIVLAFSPSLHLSETKQGRETFLSQGKPPERIRADVAADIANFWPQMVTYQNDYRQDNGTFWQGLHTHSQRPRNGVRETPDQLDNHPTDQAQSWRAAWDGLGPREWRGRVDVYEGPSGYGWVLTVELELSDGVWTRAWNEGSELWRATDWVMVTP